MHCSRLPPILAGVLLTLLGPGAAADTVSVTNRGSGELAVLWGVRSHPLAIDAHEHGIGISPDDRRLYVANNVFGGEGSLSEIDAETFRELRRIPLGGDHEQVALSADGRRAYLTGGFALGGHDELSVVDLGTGAVTRVGTGGRRPFGILRTP